MFYAALAITVIFLCFWCGQLVFVKRHLNWTNRMVESGEADDATGVSIIHPIKDLDYELEKNLESWFNQNYKGPVEHIFSFQQPDDPAIAEVSAFLDTYRQSHRNMIIDAQIIVNPVISGLNGKNSNMVHGVRVSKYDILLFGDSDIRIKPDFIVKMIRPLKDLKVGATTCGQINLGGKDFWTRFFTFLQNNETIFFWSFLLRLGADVGITGAAYAMRKKLLEEVGGLEAFGVSLLEDMHLGNTLYRAGYKLLLGPYPECHVSKIGLDKIMNYGKRIATGLKTHLTVELPSFIFMLFWYWIIFIVGVVTGNHQILYLSLAAMALRTVQGLLMRVVSGNTVKPVDVLMGLLFDLFGTFFLIYSLNNPFITWRGIRYELKKGGYIKRTFIEKETEALSEETRS